MATPAQVLRDPQFHALPLSDRRTILGQLDPEFAVLPPADQDQIFQQFSAKFAPGETVQDPRLDVGADAGVAPLGEAVGNAVTGRGILDPSAVGGSITPPAVEFAVPIPPALATPPRVPGTSVPGPSGLRRTLSPARPGGPLLTSGPGDVAPPAPLGAAGLPPRPAGPPPPEIGPRTGPQIVAPSDVGMQQDPRTGELVSAGPPMVTPIGPGERPPELERVVSPGPPMDERAIAMFKDAGDRLAELIVASAAIGGPGPPAIGLPISQEEAARASEAYRRPVMDLQQLLPAREQVALLPTEEQVAIEGLRAVADFASGFTSPETAAILGATAGTTAAEVAAARAVSGVGLKALREALSAYFAGALGKQALDSSKDISDAWKRGDLPAVSYALVSTGLAATMAGAAATHAVTNKFIPPAAREKVFDFRTAAVDAMREAKSRLRPAVRAEVVEPEIGPPPARPQPVERVPPTIEIRPGEPPPVSEAPPTAPRPAPGAAPGVRAAPEPSVEGAPPGIAATRPVLPPEPLPSTAISPPAGRPASEPRDRPGIPLPGGPPDLGIPERAPLTGEGVAPGGTSGTAIPPQGVASSRGGAPQPSDVRTVGTEVSGPSLSEPPRSERPELAPSARTDILISPAGEQPASKRYDTPGSLEMGEGPDLDILEGVPSTGVGAVPRSISQKQPTAFETEKPEVVSGPPAEAEPGGMLAEQGGPPTAGYQEPPPVTGPPEVVQTLHPPEAAPLLRLKDAVSEKLRAGESFDNAELFRQADAAFGGTLAQGKYTPRDAYDAMEAAVAHAIAEGQIDAPLNDPKYALAKLNTALQSLPTQTLRTQEQQALQQFSTPPTIAYVMAHALNPQVSDVVLEPSAGTGMLAAFARREGAKVEVNEIAPRRADLLRAQGYEPHSINAEQLNNIRPGQRPTAILMNPPFSAAGVRGIQKNDTDVGVRHLEQALMYLAPGGRLVALMGEGMEFGKAKFTDWWARMSRAYNVRANIHISGDLYRKHGTSFGTQLIVIDKTGPTPGATTAERLANVERGAYTNLEEVANALRAIREDRKAVRPEAAPRPIAPQPGRPGGVSGPRGSGGPGGQSAAGARPVAGAPAGAGPQNLPQPQPRPRPEPSAQPGQPQPGAGPRVGPGGGAERPKAVARVEAEDVEQAGVKLTQYRAHPDVAGFPEHPADLVESASMAAVSSPPIHYADSIPEGIHKASGKPLSSFQVADIRLAGQRHERLLPGKENRRAGYFVGHGTGAGKGQILAGIVLDNWYKGRKRAIWVSKSWDLMKAAKEDFESIVGKDHPILASVKGLDDWAASEDIDIAQGVVFTTYDTFKSGGKAPKVGEGEEPAQPTRLRIEQLKQWAGDSPVAVFDEAHLAKNALVGQNGQPTIVGQRVLKFQDEVPDARIVYSSATGATDVQNMGYMSRLGLWGPGTPFPDFNTFLAEIEDAGLGGKELLARDMKALGIYNAVSLSMKGVGYREVTHELTDEQIEMYDASARVWQTVWKNLNKVLDDTGSPSYIKSNKRAQLWGFHQRFFRQVTTAMKVPTLIKEAAKDLKEGRSVVIGLIGTGESRTGAEVSRARVEGSDLDDLDFSPKQTLVHFLEKIFPTQEFQEVEDPENPGSTIVAPVTGPNGELVQNQEAVAMRDEMIAALAQIKIPDNPLDQIVNHFGVENVAELTGRRNRLVIDKVTGKRDYVKRKIKGVPMDKTNLAEMAAFQNGDKRVAIISAAADTGISLHASNRAKNQQRRVHYALELGWSADRQLQQFGRTHRTDQAVAPEYVLLSTNVGGEKRFSSTIARRLGSLGAITRGQRDATGGGQLAKYDFESKYGSSATDTLYGLIESAKLADEGRGLTSVDFAQIVDDMGLNDAPQNDFPRVKVGDQTRKSVPSFLNRLLGIEVARQEPMFDRFLELFDTAIQNAKAGGTFDEGVEDLKANEVRIVQANQVAEDELTKAPTFHFELAADIPTKPVSWEAATRRIGSHQDWFYRDKEKGNFVLAHRTSGNVTDSEGHVWHNYAIMGPEREQYRYVREDKFGVKYERVEKAHSGTVDSLRDIEPMVRPWWDKRVSGIPAHTTEVIHLLSGAVLPLWKQLQSVRGAGLKVMRVTAKGGQRVVGVVIPDEQVAKVLAAIGVARNVTKPEDIFEAVYENGERIRLLDGLSLARVRWRGDDAIELKGHNQRQWGQLRKLGLQEVLDQFERRFFVPTERAVGLRAIESLTAAYPPQPAAPKAGGGFASLARDERGALMPDRLAAFARQAVQDLTGGQGLEGLAKVTALAAKVTWKARGFTDPNGMARWGLMTAHTPRYVSELHPAFIPGVERFAQAYEEQGTISSDLFKVAGAFLTLDKDAAKKLNGRLADARMTSQPDTDRKGLSPEQIAADQAVRDAMNNALDRLKDLAVDMASNGAITTAEGMEHEDDVREALEASGLTEKRAAIVADRVWEILQEIEKARAKGYIPFTRFGEWTYGIYPKSGRGQPLTHEAQPTAIEAAARFQKLIHTPRYKSAIASGKYVAREPQLRIKDPESEHLKGLGAFEIYILRKIAEVAPEVTIDVEGKTTSLAEALGGQIQAELQRFGFRAHFLEAKLVPGFERDFQRSVADYILGLSRHIANVKALRDVTKLVAKIPQKQKRLRKYAGAYLDYMRSAPAEYGWLRSLAFHYHLGFLRPFKALINATQVAMMTGPWLLQHASPAVVAKEIGKAYADVATAVVVDPLPRIDYEKLPEDVRQAAKHALEDGTLKAQQMEELTSIAGRRRKSIAKAEEVSAALFSGSEHINRLVTFLAAHRIWAATPPAMEDTIKARKALSKRGWAEGIPLEAFSSAGDFAEYTTRVTQLEYGRYNRPMLFWSTGPLKWAGPLVGVFKSFNIGQLELAARLARSRITPGGGPEPPDAKARAKMAFIAWVGMLALGAGFYGLPFVKDIVLSAEAAWKKFAKEDLDFDGEAHAFLSKLTNEQRADFLLHGLRAYNPFDASGSLSLGEPIGIGRGLRYGDWLGSASALFGMTGRVAAGVGELGPGGGGVVEAIRAGAPGTLQDIEKAARFEREGLRTRAGGQMIPKEAFSQVDLWATRFGVPLSEVSRAYEKERRNTMLATGPNELRSRIRQRVARAIDQGSSAEIEEAFKEFHEFNRTHPRNIITPRSIEEAVEFRKLPPDVRRLMRLPASARGAYEIEGGPPAVPEAPEMTGPPIE